MSKKKPDQFEGVGGAYVIDPKTGERKRAENHAPAAAPTTTPERDASRPTETGGKS